jgi:MerR family transcriptional regulator, light-induced transcriptional regulator
MSGNDENTMGTNLARESILTPPGNLQEPGISPRIVERVLTNLARFSVIPEIYSSLERQGAKRTPSEDDKAFQLLVLHGNYASCVEFIQERIDGNVTFRGLCLGLMSNAARDFGEQWAQDELTFLDVTVALARMHLLLHDFSKAERSVCHPDPSSIVLASAPCEQHAFGVSVVAKVFEFEGWSVTGGPSLQAGAELEELVNKQSFDVAGISAATEDAAKALEPKIADLRRASSNPKIAVIVGGGGFSHDPELYRHIGADGFASDANAAVITARSLVGPRPRPSQ